MRVQDAARIFNSGEISRLARGDLSFVNRVAEDFLLIDPKNISISDIFEKTYLEVEKLYRFEYVYKNTIVNKILLGRHSLNTATMLTEFRVDKNIADCVVVNGISTCYEIKTEFDSLIRLQEQLDSYQKTFDRVYVVIDEKHTNNVSSEVTDSVGIISFTKKNTLSVVKKADDISPDLFSIDIAMNSMRSGEYKLLAEKLSGNIPDVGNIYMFDACREIIHRYDPLDVKIQYREIIKNSRKNNRSLLDNLPRSLKNVGISYSLSVALQKKLLNLLQDGYERNSYVLSRSQRETK